MIQKQVIRKMSRALSLSLSLSLSLVAVGFVAFQFSPLTSAVAAPRTCTTTLDGITGAGTEGSPYLITSADDLDCMRQAVNEGLADATNKTWQVTQNLDLSEASTWIPIGKPRKPFTGKFYGRSADYEILEIKLSKISALEYRNGGLFDVVEDSTLSNLRIFANVNNSYNAGALAGEIYNSELNKIQTFGDIKGREAGGVVGYCGMEVMIFRDVLNEASVSGELFGGGIVGECHAESSIFERISNMGVISGGLSAGGIIGATIDYEHKGAVEIDQATNFGVIGGGSAGGAIGLIYSSVTIKNVINYGEILSSDDAGTGGIIGHTFWNTDISYAYNAGTVRGTDYVGGIIGITYSDKIILHEIINNGVVWGTGYAHYYSQFPGRWIGGILGYAVVEPENYNFYNLVNLNSIVYGDSYLYGLSPSVGIRSSLYRWEGVSKNDRTYSPFTSSDSHSGDGAPVNCASFADPNWWTKTAGFTEADWDFSNVSKGYVPVPKGVTDLVDDESELLVPFNCMTTVTTNDPAQGSATPAVGLTKTLATDSPSSKVYVYPASLTSLVYTLPATATDSLQDVTIFQTGSTKPAISLGTDTIITLNTSDAVRAVRADQTLNVLWESEPTPDPDPVPDPDPLPPAPDPVVPPPAASTTSTSTKSTTSIIAAIPSATGSKLAFTDTKGLDSDRASAIEWLVKTGVTVGSGCEAGSKSKCKFSPSSAVNRGAMAQFLQKLAGWTDSQLAEKYQNVTSKFTDIVSIKSSNLERYYAILWLADTGITVGSGCTAEGGANAATSNCTFNPAGSVNRGAMAEFMQKFASVTNVPATTSEFPDVKTSSVAIKYSGSEKTTTVKALTTARIGAINWLASQKITEGSGQGAIAGGKSKSAATFRPQDAVNRGAMAQFMKRLANTVTSI